MKYFLNQFLQNAWRRSLLAFPKLAQLKVYSSKTMAFIRVWNYLSAAKIEGDYLEFGVYEGNSFNLAMRSAEKFYVKNGAHRPHFFAFDSFEGLPNLHPKKDVKGLFSKGEYSASQKTFLKKIRRTSRNWKVHIIPGFYEVSLTPDIYKNYALSKAAFVTIDCDLYSSTKEALRFLTPILQSGTILFFDDWFSVKGDMSLGEAGACHEWLQQNPWLSLIDFGSVGVMGKLFIVNVKK